MEVRFTAWFTAWSTMRRQAFVLHTAEARKGFGRGVALRAALCCQTARLATRQAKPLCTRHQVWPGPSRMVRAAVGHSGPSSSPAQELWTLLHFLDDGEFASRESFLAAYGDIKDPKTVLPARPHPKCLVFRLCKQLLSTVAAHAALIFACLL